MARSSTTRACGRGLTASAVGAQNGALDALLKKT